MRASLFMYSAFACLLAVGNADAANLVPGDYLAKGGWGQLEIRSSANKSLSFVLTTVGSNATGCDLGGIINGDRAVLDTPEEGKTCTVVFSASPGMIEVKPGEEESCRDFCGVNAWFSGQYIVSPAQCTAAAKASAQKRFTALYRTKSYAPALAELAPILSDCQTTLHWLEAARIRNDVAITQYHLGQMSECRNTLAPVLKDAKKDEDQLRDTLPPDDFENFLPIAKAAWHNAKLCSGAAKQLNKP